MGIKVLVVSLMLTSIIFSFLYLIPTRLTTPSQPIINLTKSNMSITSTNPYPVTFSYLISASKGDSVKLKRMLYALYHPGNYYLIHMDYEATEAEHRDIAEFVGGNPVFGQVGNVWVVGKPNLVTYRGPTMLATTIHALALVLRTCSRWDWFVNLSASDYPLITQDDLIHAFSDLPRDLNFIQHSSHLGWKLNKRGKPITIDPALHSLNKSELWWVIKQRALPTAFKLYTGSAWTMLSRSFAEYCVVGWDNLPRTLLLYYTNFVSSPEGYFQTLICNSEDYKNTTINHDPTTFHGIHLQSNIPGLSDSEILEEWFKATVHSLESSRRIPLCLKKLINSCLNDAADNLLMGDGVLGKKRRRVYAQACRVKIMEF